MFSRPKLDLSKTRSRRGMSVQKLPSGFRLLFSTSFLGSPPVKSPKQEIRTPMRFFLPWTSTGPLRIVTLPQANMEAPRTRLEDLAPSTDAFWELPCSSEKGCPFSPWKSTGHLRERASFEPTATEERYAHRLRWAHAVNSQRLLRAALTSNSHFIEAGLVLKKSEGLLRCFAF